MTILVDFLKGGGSGIMVVEGEELGRGSGIMVVEGEELEEEQEV